VIGIIGAMDEELRLLVHALSDKEELSSGPFLFYRGVLDGQEVVLLRSGIGKVNAAVGCALLVERFSPRLVINTGSAGGLGAGLTFGDVIIADDLVYHDVDVTAFGYALGQLPGQPASFVADTGLVTLAERAFDSLKSRGALPPGVNRVRGRVASGDVFMHESQRIAAVRDAFPSLAAVEMESAAIAHTCALFGVGVLIIRSLSDIAGAESPLSFEEFLPLASERSALLVREILKEC